MPQEFSGSLITFEGINGSGKSSHMKSFTGWVQKALSRYHFEVQYNGYVYSRQPGGTQLGEKLRPILVDTRWELDTMAVEMLFAADRAQHHKEVIAPALTRNKLVVLDRYIDTSFAYARERGISLQTTAILNDLATNGIEPDLTFLLDCPAAIAAERVNELHGRTREQWEVDSAVIREHFNQRYLDDPARIVWIDTTKDKKDAQDEIRHVFIQWFEATRVRAPILS